MAFTNITNRVRQAAAGAIPQKADPRNIATTTAQSAIQQLPQQAPVQAPVNIPSGFAPGINFQAPLPTAVGPPSDLSVPGFVPPTGLIGGEEALIGSTTEAIRALRGGSQEAVSAFTGGEQQAIETLRGGAEQAVGTLGTAEQRALASLGGGIGTARQDISGGAQGADVQAALAGLLGPAAQAEAFRNFESSPGQQFLQEEAERSLLRNQAAVGGLGGGNVLRELQRQAIGLAQQDFSNQFQRGEQALGRQQTTARDLANLSAQEGVLGSQLITGAGQDIAGVQLGTGQDIAGAQLGTGQNIAGTLLGAGRDVAGTLTGAGRDVAAQRFATGQQLAQAAGGTASNLSNLQSQLGAQVAGVTGQGLTNLANLLSGTGAANAQQLQQLSTTLANLGVGGATSAAAFTSLAGQFDAAGILGQNTAVTNTLSSLIELIPQGGSSLPPSGATISGSAGQQVA